jgi:hypothetical protein
MTRIVVEISTEEHLTNDAVAKDLWRDPTLFVRGHRLVEIVPAPEIDGRQSPPVICEVTYSRLREKLTRLYRFVEPRGKAFSDAHPQGWCVEAVLNRKAWPGVRPLQGIATCPVLRPDGSVLCQPGYDAATGLYLWYSGEPIELPKDLTQQDAMEAVAELLALTEDFPFASEADHSAFLAALLTPFARPAIKGPTPLFAFDANLPGSGKGKLAQIVGLLATGESIDAMPFPRHDDEMRKQITSIALGGSSLVLIDNVAVPVSHPSLDLVLTANGWRDRLLNSNNSVRLPCQMVWLMTGNNLQFGGDTVRRVCRCRLESKVEHPEDRDKFQIPDLIGHVEANLTKYRRAALTILAVYHAAGRPEQKTRSVGSFEQWCGVVCGALVYAGMPDPANTICKLREESSCPTSSVRSLFDVWHLIDKGRGLKAAEILAAAKNEQSVADAVRELCPDPSGQLPTGVALGSRLSARRGAVIGNRTLESRDSRGTKVWQVVEIPA